MIKIVHLLQMALLILFFYGVLLPCALLLRLLGYTLFEEIDKNSSSYRQINKKLEAKNMEKSY